MPTSYIYTGDPMTGTANDDFVIAYKGSTGTDNNTINANGGDDLVIGDSSDTWIPGASYLNGSLANAFSLETLTSTWTTAENEMFGDWTVPHTTAIVEATIGQSEYFKVVVGAGQQITIDLDFASNTAIGNPRDLVVELQDFLGNIIATADDSLVSDGGQGSSPSAPGSASSYDPYLTFAVATAGTYYINVRPFGGGPGSTFTDNNTFVMNVSVTGHATNATNPVQGSDTINGSDGNDTIFGQGGNDTINGDAGNDFIDAGSGSDIVHGGEGDDIIYAGLTAGVNEILDGGADTDTLDTTTWNGTYVINLVTGTTNFGESFINFENVVTGNGADTITGTAGDNIITTQGGIDTVQAGAGNDTVSGGAGGDTLDGGADFDILDYRTSPGAVAINLATNSASGGDAAGDVISNFEGVIGSALGDALTGDNGNNTLSGFGGSDTLVGLAGNDTVSGGAGGDTMDGGADFDTLDYRTSPGAVTINLATNSASGGDATGDVISSFEGVDGSVFGDALTGDGGNNTLRGFEGSDTLIGLGGTDSLQGGAGNDVLIGGAGDDTLVGGGGFDTAVFSGNRASYTISQTLVSGPNGSDSLNGIDKLQFDDQAVVLRQAVTKDFSSDDKSDILWQNDSGQAAVWLMDGLNLAGNSMMGPNPGSAWHLKGAGDFNNDAKADILWQDDTGQVAIWLMDGSNLTTSAWVSTPLGPTWHALTTGDFNGDNKSDILFQNDSGQAGIWLMDGLNPVSSSGVGANPGPSWHVEASGDFNGDGKSDILWQNANGQSAIWLMDGLNVVSGNEVGANPGPTWHVEASGDFNGDGKSDILFQNDNGQAAIWLMDGLNIIDGDVAGPNPGPTWHAEATGDYNGDGKSDILWQNDSGQVGVWLMNGLSLLNTGIVSTAPPVWHAIGADAVASLADLQSPDSQSNDVLAAMDAAYVTHAPQQLLSAQLHSDLLLA